MKLFNHTSIIESYISIIYLYLSFITYSIIITSSNTNRIKKSTSKANFNNLFNSNYIICVSKISLVIWIHSHFNFFY